GGTKMSSAEGSDNVSNQIKISQDVIELQQLVAPEISQIIEMRYNILSTISSEQPIGRRNLAFVLDMSERAVRNEIDFFQSQKLVSVERQGVVITEAGKNALVKLKSLLYTYNGLEQLEKELTEKLHLKKVFICPGDMDMNYEVLRFMGRSGAKYVLSVMKYKDTLALTGGNCTAAVADEMREAFYPDVYVIPARGGIGKSHSTQANNVVAEMGLKLHSNYELLHLPDNIDQRLLEALKDYPEIKRVFTRMDEIDIFIFGLGRADVLADWRNMSATEKKNVLSMGAVGEAFGHYFNINGEVVSPSSTIGISIENFKKIPHAIAIAGGAGKAESIISISRIRDNIVLVTDESAAREILKQLNTSKDSNASDFNDGEV
ncbi:MAG: central glycolytic s regulator, partial [Eubacteriaceae bacterium]|nr:central glycolytic s regulator [Eubacteriaceae bacterium]